MQSKIIERYFFFGLLFATFIFTSFIFQPFWVVLTLGICFAIVLHPVYDWFLSLRVPEILSALFTVLLFTIILCGPLLATGAIIFKQSQEVYHYIGDTTTAKPFFDKVDDSVNKILPEGMSFDVKEKTSAFISYVSGNIAKIFSATISAFFSFLLMLLIIFYFLKDGARWRKAIVVLSPLSDTDDQKIIDRLKYAINGVVIGSLLIAILQGLLMGLGLWIFGVPNSALWGVVAAVASLLPTFGTSLVSVPAMLFLFVNGNTASAIGLLVWAGLAVGTVDNFLSPFLVARKTNIPPLLILFSVLGGISLLGPVGILVGPLAVSLLYTLISIYRNEFKQSTPNEFI